MPDGLKHGDCSVLEILRDVNKLRAAVLTHDIHKVDDAWSDFERWTYAFVAYVEHALALKNEEKK